MVDYDPQVSLSLLGVPRLRADDRPLRLSYLKAEALLYYLAETAQPQSRATLAALFWGQADEPRARNSLRNALYTIRRGLEPAEVLLVDRDSITLSADRISLDLRAFSHAIDQTTSENLAEALALWRGPFLDGYQLPDAPDFEAWLADRRNHYQALYTQGLLQLSHWYEADGQLALARRTIEKLISLDPLHEAAHQHLMRLYMQENNRAAALNQYESLRHHLSEKLGVDPAHGSQALHLEILHADKQNAASLIKNVQPELPSSSKRSRFVGRKHEITTLNTLHQLILAGGPAHLVMLEGEPGIGKTRLAQEWLATLADTLTLTTRCFETGQTIPFQPWIDLIGTCLQQMSVQELGLADVWLTELAHLVPEIRAQRQDLALLPPLDPELARGLIIQAVHKWLETLARRQPLCLFIDDVQWIDQASLALLRYILNRPHNSGLPLLIVASQREAETIPDWSQLRPQLERENRLQRLRLYRLSLPEVSSLAQSIGLPETDQSDAFLKRLFRETEGNPLFIIEILHTLDLAALKSEEDWPIPRTIQGVIQNRLARLSPETQQVLSAASIIGRVFDDDILQGVSDLPYPAILQALDDALAANLITEHGQTYDFTHEKIRTVLIDGLTQSWRRYLHAQLAQVLEREATPDHARLSYHFQQSGQHLPARHYALRAARQAVQLYAGEDALRWYERVEGVLASTPSELPSDEIPDVTPFRQAHVAPDLPLDILGLIYRQRGLIHQRSGLYDQAEMAFRKALERGCERDRTDEQAAACNLLSFLAYLRGDYDSVSKYAHRALDLVSRESEVALRAQGLRRLGIAVYRTGDYARARALYDEALAAYQQIDNRLGIANVYNNIGFVLRTEGHYQEAIQALEKALAIYQDLGRTEGVALIHSNMGRTYAFSGNLERALQVLHRGLALSEETHIDWITVKIHRTLGSVYFRQQAFQTAQFHASQAQTLAQNLGSDEDLGAALRLRGEIAVAWPAGQMGDPDSYFEQSIAILKKVGAQDELERATNAQAAFRAKA